MAFGQIIINRDGVTRVEQFFRANRADISRAAGDKNIHVGAEGRREGLSAQWGKWGSGW